MSKKTNPAAVGAFVVGAITLAIIGIMVLGGQSLLDEQFECVLYFDESISGLDIGAPVDYQGVRVGTVKDVWIELDDQDPGAIYRPVVMQIEHRRIYGGGMLAKGHMRENMEKLVVERGLRARLATQSILTGKLKVELGNFPGEPIQRKGRDQDLWEMPTVVSPMQRVTQELSQLPINDIVHETHRAIQRLAELLDPAVSGATLKNLNETLGHLDSMLAKVDANLEPLLEGLNKTSGEISRMLDPESPAREEIYALLEDVRRAARSFQRLSDYLEQHPESILRGKQE